MDTRRSISSVITRVRLVPVSLEWHQRAVSKCIKHHTTHHEPIQCVNVSWGGRRERLDHMVILHEKQLHRVLRAYVAYFNRARPHHGIHQQVPAGTVPSVPPEQPGHAMTAVSVLGELHHEYRSVA